MAGHVCPWWLGYFHLGPLRRWLEKPEKILSRYVKPGMTVAEIGPGMGFFTLPMARMVGPEGKVYAIDLQPRMIKVLDRRAARAGLAERVESRVCGSESLGTDDLAGCVDFAFAFYVVHEVPDVPSFFEQVSGMLVDGGGLFIAEPKGHVKPESFEATLTAARESGLSLVEHPEMWRSRSAVLKKS
jgi:ubiquinone/menaquinone biosynthesis C-methylase UbiE